MPALRAARGVTARHRVKGNPHRLLLYHVNLMIYFRSSSRDTSTFAPVPSCSIICRACRGLAAIRVRRRRAGVNVTASNTGSASSAAHSASLTPP